MARTARIRFVPLQNTLANVPLSIYSPLVQAQKVRDSPLARRPGSRHADASLMQRPQALALHVTSADGREAYLGWSGLSAARSLPGGSALVDEALEVDPGVGEAFGWSEGDVVELAVLHALPQAQTVSVAPLAPEDWDVIVRGVSLARGSFALLRALLSGFFAVDSSICRASTPTTSSRTSFSPSASSRLASS